MRCQATTSGLVWQPMPVKATAEERSALLGTWKAIAGSQAGYRMREIFVGGAAKSEAVGRTSDVVGSFVIDTKNGSLRVRSAKIVVGIGSLTSDKPGRDDWLKTNALQTSVHTSAVFELTEELSIGATRDGEVMKRDMQGRLSLHGVTGPVAISIQARRTGDLIDIVGSTRIVLADFGIETPFVPGIVSTDDTGLLEFALVLKR